MSVDLGYQEGCPKCAAKDHPFKCFVCEHDGTLEWYRTHATTEEICTLIMLFKLCTKHAQALDELKDKRDIERYVA